MPKTLRNIFVFILIVFLIAAFSSSHNALNLDNLAYVLAIGIDVSNQNELEVTFQFASPSSSSSSSSESSEGGGNKPILDSVHASSINNAINLMNNHIGRKINLSHCKFYIFSEEIAKRGIQKELYTLCNNTQVRPSSNILISKCNAKYYIQKTEPELEISMSNYYETLKNSSEYTGYIPNSTIGSFFHAMLCKDCQPYAILGTVSDPNNKSTESLVNSQKDYLLKTDNSPVSGKNNVDNVGIAVFKDDKIVGELNALETICFLALNNKLSRFLISIPDPSNSENYIDIYLGTYNTPKIEVDTSTSSPYIKIKIDLTGRIYSMSKNANYLDSDTLNAISDNCNNYLNSAFSEFLFKTSKEFHSDINGFGKNALKNFKTTSDLNDYHWLDSYKDAFFDIDINTSIKSSMLITET